MDIALYIWIYFTNTLGGQSLSKNKRASHQKIAEFQSFFKIKIIFNSRMSSQLEAEEATPKHPYPFELKIAFAESGIRPIGTIRLKETSFQAPSAEKPKDSSIPVSPTIPQIRGCPLLQQHTAHAFDLQNGGQRLYVQNIAAECAAADALAVQIKNIVGLAQPFFNKEPLVRQRPHF